MHVAMFQHAFSKCIYLSRKLLLIAQIKAMYIVHLAVIRQPYYSRTCLERLPHWLYDMVSQDKVVLDDGFNYTEM